MRPQHLRPMQRGPHFVRNALLIAVAVALVLAGTYFVASFKPAALSTDVKVLTTFNPVLAKVQVANILKGLIQVDPADAAYFTANAQAYRAKLDVLDAEFVNLTANPATRFFVTFHEAFAYFAKQYNLTQIPIAGPFE